jgi:hypothetical protein
MKVTYYGGIILDVPFPMICGTPHSSSRLGRYVLVKLEAPKSGHGTPSLL